MTKKNRTLALLLAAALVFAMVFSSLYIAKNADHHCTQEDCAICLQLEVCQATLHTTALAALAISLVHASTCRLQRMDALHSSFFNAASLVSLKVKLSN